MILSDITRPLRALPIQECIVGHNLKCRLPPDSVCRKHCILFRRFIGMRHPSVNPFLYLAATDWGLRVSNQDVRKFSQRGSCFRASLANNGRESLQQTQQATHTPHPAVIHGHPYDRCHAGDGAARATSATTGHLQEPSVGVSGPGLGLPAGLASTAGVRRRLNAEVGQRLIPLQCLGG